MEVQSTRFNCGCSRQVRPLALEWVRSEKCRVLVLDLLLFPSQGAAVQHMYLSAVRVTGFTLGECYVSLSET
jgi:hypothetical protein